MVGYNSTDRPIKKTTNRMMVVLFLFIDLSLMLCWGFPLRSFTLLRGID
jgi:hypothetical protein